eukprot:6652109-Pyramimonas_sp.AAC.1
MGCPRRRTNTSSLIRIVYPLHARFGSMPGVRATSLDHYLVEATEHGGNVGFQVVDEYLAKVITRATENAQEEGWSTGRELRVPNMELGEDPTPWFTSYQDQFFRTLTFSEHESFDHPLACMLVNPISSDCESTPRTAKQPPLG